MALISRSISITFILEIGERLIDHLSGVLLSHSLSFQKALILYDGVNYVETGICKEF